MKKLFKYEINESIAAKAAMNCVHKRLFKELYMGRPAPQEQVMNGDYDLDEWENDAYGNGAKRELVIQALIDAKLIHSKEEGLPLNSKIQEIMNNTNMPVTNADEAMKFVNAYGHEIVGKPQEQEETDYTNDDIPSYHFSYQDSFLVWAMRNVIPYLKEKSQVCAQADPNELKHAVMKVLKEEGRFGAPESQRGCEHWVEEKGWKVEEYLGGSQEQEEDGINKGGMHNLVQFGHIMNTPSMHDELEPEFSDLREQEGYNMNFRAIAELVADQIDRENPEAKGVENNMDTIFDIVKEVWRNNDDDLWIYDYDEVDEDACMDFFDNHYEEIKNAYFEKDKNNIMNATHDDLFASENEEEDYSNDSQGIEMIIDLMVAKHLISDGKRTRQIAQKLIERKLNEEGMWIGDDDHEAERFVSFFGEDMAEEIAHWRW